MRRNTSTIARTRIVGVAAIAALLVLSVLPAISAQETIDLGTADSFAILAGAAVTNTGPSVINGNIGVHPGTSVTGFGDATVNGEIHIADAVAEQAKADLTEAYNDAAGRSPATMVETELGDEVLTPGVYNSQSGTFGLTGQLTLDAQGDQDAVWVFQMQTTLITAVDSSVILIDGAQACNVFWQVGSSATLDTGTKFKGNILAQDAITMNNGATLDGRALARVEAVTLINNEITIAECAPDPPGDDPPGDDPPGDDPPGDDPPGDDPPGDDPPGDDPPGDDPPGDDPPGDDPPGDDPPGDDPPGDDPPGDDPPGDDPPGDDPTGDDPPGDDPSMVCSTDLEATANADSSITLTWNSIEGAEHFRIYRAVGDGAFVLHAEVDGDVTQFIDTDTQVDATNLYELRPVIDGVVLEDCDIVEVTVIPFFPGLLAGVLALVGGVAAYAVIRRRN